MRHLVPKVKEIVKTGELGKCSSFEVFAFLQWNFHVELAILYICDP